MQYPKHVEIIEVGPRDGFQNVKEFIPTQIKLDIINDLIESGIKEMQLTSFVNPKVLPQMADASEVTRTILKSGKKPLRPIALVPNFKGARDAYENGIRTVSFVISASEKHNMANVNCSKEESVDTLRNIISSFYDLDVRLDIATAFACPFEGMTPEDSVHDLVKIANDAGVKEIVICDTIGIANPKHVATLCEKLLTSSTAPLALHIHDTRGLGLVNMLAGLQTGIRRFETAIGGLGGCPFAPGAAGNTATEDAINMFESMGIATGIDLEKYLKAVEVVKQRIKCDLTSRMCYARTYEHEKIKLDVRK